MTMSIRYINDRFLPDKAIDLLDEAASKVQLAGYKTPEGIVQTENHLRHIYAAKEEAVKAQDFDLAKELQAEQEKAEEELNKARERYEKQCRNKKLVVKEEDIAEVVSDWTKIPVKKLAEGESNALPVWSISFTGVSSARMKQYPQWQKR